MLTWRVGARVDTNSGPALQDISWEQVQGEALLWVGGSLSAFTTSTVVTVPSWIIQNQLLLERDEEREKERRTKTKRENEATGEWEGERWTVMHKKAEEKDRLKRGASC